MKKKLLALLLTVCMVISMAPAALAAGEDVGPDMTGSIVNVTAGNAQDVLDGKYGDITGKTINFTENITVALDLARPTKYQGSGTVYYNYVNSQLDTEPTAWSEDIFSVMNSHSRYNRTLEDVTFTADDGVTVAGFTFSAGHVASSGYDYVRDVEQTSGVTYYKHSSLENISFEGLTITGQFDAQLYMADCVVEDITFDGCTFTGTVDVGENAAIKFLADNQYFIDITVKNCDISNYFQGVFIQGVDGAEIVGNTISETVHNAIALQSYDVAAKGTIDVAENYISDVTNRAIRLNAVSGDAVISVNNNIMVNCGDEDGQLIKAGDVDNEATIDLESNYWNGKDVTTAVSGLTAPSTVGITGGTWDEDVTAYLAEGYEVDESGNIVVDESAFAVKVGEKYFNDLQKAIVAAAPDGTVEILKDVVVDEWIMIAESLSISSGQLITLKIDDLTIDGNNNTLTINSIESAGNGNRLFYDAENLNINDLTITYADGVSGGIGLQSGVLSNVTINGGSQGVFPGAGEITITGCTFKTGKAAIYNEVDRDNLVVTGNTFDVGVDNYAIYLRGDTTFSDNIVTSGKVNVVNGSPVVTGNDFGDNRFKVYNNATATIESNAINNLVFDQPEDETMSTFTGNTLSEAAQAALDATGAENASYVARVGETMYADLQEAIKDAAPAGTVEIIDDVIVDEWVMIAESLTIGSGQIITLEIDGLTINGNDHTLTVKDIESAGNGNRLFYDATNLNIQDLTIKYADGVAGGIGLRSGELNNVTFEGGVYGVLPGDGNVTIEDCTFKTNGTAIYFEEERDNLTVSGNTFELDAETNVILLRGDVLFENNNIQSGRTVNVVSGSPVVSGNTFADGVRLKVYNDATADIVNNTITVLAFDDDSEVKSKFEGNILSAEAQAVLDSMNVENAFDVTISVPDGATIVVKDSDRNEVTAEDDGTYKLVNGTYTYTVSKSGYNTKGGSFTVSNADVSFSVSLSVYIPYIPSDPSYRVTVNDLENGEVSITPASATVGQTVTVTVDPDKGYVLETLTVLDKNGNEVNLTYKGDGKYTFKMPASKVTVHATFMEDNIMLNYFVDVFASDYYYDAVLWAVENGITNGTSATTFSPDAVCTRAQVVTFLWRAAGAPEPKSTEMPFTDVATNSYYYNAVLWAVEKGITLGTGDNKFSPDAECTRGQIVTFLWRSQGSEMQPQTIPSWMSLMVHTTKTQSCGPSQMASPTALLLPPLAPTLIALAARS